MLRLSGLNFGANFRRPKEIFSLPPTMSAEAEKVINLSLCKMAESRGIRRGGSSLHKHLLIASVLTKARSAYFENWYLGDNDCTSVNVNGDHLPLPSSAESSGTAGTEEDQLSLNQILDPSFFVEVETEIELPSDILSCVEKLGDMSDMHLGFTVSGEVDLNSRIQDEEDMLGEIDDDDDQVTSTTTDMVQGDSESDKRNGAEITYTYLDLDSSKEATGSSTSVPVSANSLPSLFPSISPSPTPSQQSPSKRRRGWSFDQEDDSDDEDEVEVPCSASPELQDKLKLKGRNVRHNAKRLRSSLSSSSANATDVFDSSNLASTTPLPPPSFSFEGKNHFRTKKSHFDVDEEESANDDTFLDGDGDDDDSWCGGNGKGKSSSDHNDRRVPSASSSSSSDEEQETGSCSMEVDQITSLVQYFSFQKQQGNSVPTGSAANNGMKASSSSSTSSSAQLTISRSMSSPDLCGRSGSSNSSSSGNSISCPTTKDLFSNYGLTSSHRILTMKV